MKFAAFGKSAVRIALLGPIVWTFHVAAWAQGVPASQPSTPQTDAAGPPAGDRLDEVVVTAQFRQQNLQQTPLAITALSGAMLQARGQVMIADVANEAPSVTLKPNSATYGSSLAANIRGVGQFDFHPALEPGVGVYVDDVYYATLTGSILDLLDLDRIEVLRGPQGTLAGKNSIGGAIKLYSRRPTGSDTGFISVTGGTSKRLDLRAAADRQPVPAAFRCEPLAGRLCRSARLRVCASWTRNPELTRPSELSAFAAGGARVSGRSGQSAFHRPRQP